MIGTILQQGTFLAGSGGRTNPNVGVASVSQANPTIIKIPANADWVKVYNYTKMGAAGLNTVYFNGSANALVGVEFYWQRGMAAGTGMVTYKANGVNTLSGDTMLTGGFTLYDPSGNPVTAAVVTTATSNATQPVVSTASTAGVDVGTIIRMSNTAQTDVNGIDMQVSAVTVNTNFTLLGATNALATAPGAIGGAGFYRIISYDPLFYPRRRYVTKITQAVNAQVSTSVDHQYVPGQSVRFVIPSQSGMTQLNALPENNYLTCTVLTVVDSWNFTIDVDTTAFTAFTWPTIAQQPSSFPEVTPVGENTASALLIPASQVPIDINGQQINNTQTGILSDATVNTGFLGMVLGSGGNGTILGAPIIGPAGTISWSSANAVTAQDRIYWVAGKSSLGGL